MEDGKIYITISDVRKTSGGNDGGGDGGGRNPVPQDEDEKRKDYLKHRFYNFVQSEAKQMVNLAVGNIGNFTGDYNMQRTVNAGKKIVGDLIDVGVSIAVGGIPAGVMTIMAKTINAGLQYAVGEVANRKQNYEISQLREISGLNALTNGSR